MNFRNFGSGALAAAATVTAAAAATVTAAAGAVTTTARDGEECAVCVMAWWPWRCGDATARRVLGRDAPRDGDERRAKIDERMPTSWDRRPHDDRDETPDRPEARRTTRCR